MIRETSIEAWHAIQHCAWVKKRQLDVYKVLYEHGPMTATVLCTYFPGANGVWKSIQPLKDKGLVREKFKSPCPLTKKLVYWWDVTSNLPVKPTKRESSDAIIRRLEARVVELKRALGRP